MPVSLSTAPPAVPDVGGAGHRHAARRLLRVALVNAADEGGGAERSVLTLHQSLLERGHDSRLFVGSKLTNEPKVFEIPRDRPIPGVLRVTRFLENSRGWQNLYAPWFRGLHRLIGDADVLHFHNLWGGQFAFSDLTGIVALSKRYPTVMTLRDSWMLTGHCACPIGCNRWEYGCGQCPDLVRAPALPRDATALNWRRKRRAVQRAQLHVTTVSSWLKSEVERSPIFAGKSVAVIHNSVDDRVFWPAAQNDARRHLDLPLDAFLVLMAGQAIEGIRVGISQHGVAALNRLGDRRVSALLVGHSAEHVAATLRVPTIVRPFQSSPEAMAAYYRAANVTVVPSEYESFGRVAAESLMCGTPVIAFATGGLMDIVQHDVTGLLVPSGDIASLTQALGSVVADVARLERFRSVCATRTRERFSLDRIAGEYMGVYADAMNTSAAVRGVGASS